jgi:Motility related/secretion protein
VIDSIPIGNDVPSFCCSTCSRLRRPFARFRTPALPILLALLVIPLTVNTARAQKFESRYSIDLGEVGRLYDSMYRDRVTGLFNPDSTIVFDWKTIRFGNQHERVPTFLPTDADTTREVTDYLLVPGYRAHFVVPRSAYFESTDREVGEIMIKVPRDFTTPGLEIELTPMDSVATQIMRKSRQDVWGATARANLTAFQLTTNQPNSGGITFDIPLPMPKSLESIFGPGDKTSITISGREEITIAGETRVVNPFIGVEGKQSQSLFPSLDMQQKLDVSLKGTIGDKVSIQVDHSSEAIGSDANRVRLAYTGYEDEVIQLIELGNTSLSLPGSQLVSVSTNAQGLFGIKMLAKLGSTDFTMIASKQQGEVSSATFTPTGGSLGQSETSTIRDVDYVRNKYFYIDDPASFIGARAEGFEVYREVAPNDPTDIPRTAGWAIPDPVGDGQSIRDAAAAISASGTTAEGLSDNFQRLERGTDWDFIIDARTNEPIGIELFDPIPDTALKALAVRYVNLDGTPVGGSYSSLGVTINGQPVVAGSKDDKLMLEMIKAPTPDPAGVAYSSTWRLMVRNIYNLGLTNIDGNSLDVSIEDNLDGRINPDVPVGATVPYLRIFGLDQTDRSGTGKPDGRIDLTAGVVDLNNGIIQFPSIYPFAPDSTRVAAWTDSAFAFTGDYAAQYEASRKIYTTRLTNSTLESEAHVYDIRVSAVSTSKTFRINALNIVENSENITIDGTKLARGTDYDINYDTGEITLQPRASALLTPDSQVKIDYQFKPLGGVGSSTLAGMSSASTLGENTRLGTTLLYESKSTTADRPRLGEEPSRGLVGGITGSYQHQSRVLTDIANWLPFVDTDAPSTIQVDGELAASLPNPNTKNEAYIDDFEGVEDANRIPMSRRTWYPASAPVGIVSADSMRLKEYWYNIDPSYGVHKRDLNPTLDKTENTLVQSIDLELDKNPTSADSSKYAGVMLGFSGGGLDFTQGQFLEIWVNDFKPNPLERGGKLHIDMGVIDENFFQMEKGEFNDEDKNRDGFAATFDDTGLDGVFDKDETLLPGGTPDDPHGDDIDTRKINGRYLKINGTEKNQVYDTEDLDRNGQMTRDNAYFTYTIDLADTAAIDIRQQYPGYDGFNTKAHENDSWRLYRIKLTNNTVVSPRGIQPRFDEIRHMRIWFDNADQVVRPDSTGARRIEICEFSIQGNRWENDGIRNVYGATLGPDSTHATFAVGVISTKTDPGIYNPPVVPNKVNQVSDKESSLAVRYDSLETGQAVRILKRFSGQGLDMTLYRDLNFWVHTNQLRSGVEYYFRLGTNDKNYYEIRVPFTKEFYNETGWARVAMHIADLTNMKFSPADSVVTGTAVDFADPSRVYPVLMHGLPNLRGVRFLYAGIRNVSNPEPQSGEIWMDDIFTGGVNKNFDHAERLTANVSIAGGAVSIGGNWSRTGADYRGLRQTRGSGADQTTFGLNARTDLQYFVPLAGFSIPVSGSYSHTKSLPKFPPSSDTQITDVGISDSLRTERVSRGFTTSLARRIQSNNVLMRYTADRIKPTFSYSDQRGVSPSVRDTTTNMAGSIGYQITWSGGKTLPLFGKNRIRWWLNSLDLSTSASRQTGTSWSLRNGTFQQDPYRYNAALHNQGSVRYNPFSSVESSFGVTINRDVGLPHDWYGINVGKEVGRSNTFRISFVAPRWYLVRLLEPSIEVQSNYNEDSSPNVRQSGDPTGTRNVSASRSDTGRLRFDLSRQVTTLFKWFGWDPNAASAPPPPPPGAKAPAGSPAGQPATAAADSTHKSRPGLGNLFGGIGRMLTRVQPISANIQHRLSSNYNRIPERPDLAYRLGMSTNSGIVANSITTPDQKREDLSYNVNSSVRLIENARNAQSVDLQARFSRAISDNDFRASQTRSVNTTWPDLQLKWDNLNQFAPLRPILKDGSQLTVDYRRTSIETGQKNQPPTTITGTFTFTPALVFTWKNDLNSTLNVSYTQNTNESRTPGSQIAGSKSVTSNFTVNLDLRKNFKAGGGLTFFGKGIKWTNDLESTLVVAYSKTGGERFAQGSTVSEPIPSTKTIRVGPTVRYFFSRNINGSAFVDYNRSFAEATGQTVTTVRVGITALVNF